MKRWLGAAACAVWLWAGSAAAGADDLYLPGGIVMPLGGDVEVSSAETSFWGGLLAGQMKNAVSEERLAGAIDSLRLYEDGADRDRLASLLAKAFEGGRFERLTGKGGDAEAIILTLYVSGREKAEIEELLAKAQEPDLPLAGGRKSIRRAEITAGDFSLVEAAPLRKGVSDQGVPYKWGTAALVFAGQWNLNLPFTAAYAVQDGHSGEAYTLLLALPGGAEYLLPRLEKGLARARDTSPLPAVTEKSETSASPAEDAAEEASAETPEAPAAGADAPAEDAP